VRVRACREREREREEEECSLLILILLVMCVVDLLVAAHPKLETEILSILPIGLLVRSGK
jgi:hypothetical protein